MRIHAAKGNHVLVLTSKRRVQMAALMITCVDVESNVLFYAVWFNWEKNLALHN